VGEGDKERATRDFHRKGMPAERNESGIGAQTDAR
jgi:hypothetical protein